MGTAGGTARKSLGERRQQLLDAAIEVMSERGIAGASTRAITDAAGVPQSVFHYSFDSKAALLRALLERESERALATAWQLDPKTDTLAEALDSAVQAQLARVRAEPKQFLVIAELTVVARTDPELLELSKWENQQYNELVAQLLRRWQPERSDEELRHWAAVILAGLNGLTEAWLTTRDDDASVTAATLLATCVSDALSRST